MDIYTDGSAYPNPGRGGWAFVVLDGNNEIDFSRTGKSLLATNNIMELTAILEAIKHSTESLSSETVIYSDSQYAIKSSDGTFNKLKKNKELILKIREEIKIAQKQGNHVIFEWVKGHDGNLGNEIADNLANYAAALK